jgi:hypothetical protein
MSRSRDHRRATRLLVTAAGLLVAALALVRTQQILLSLAPLLDFFIAASRPAGPPTWSSLATAALTICQRASRGLRAAQTFGRLTVNDERWRVLITRQRFRPREADDRDRAPARPGPTPIRQ